MTRTTASAKIMQRRGAIKYLTLTAGTLFVAPAWATAWTKASVGAKTAYLSAAAGDLLADVVDTIIPVTDTPGAKELGVPGFVQRMLTDCYEKEVQDKVKNGLERVDALATESYGKPFARADATQRLALLTRLASSTDTDEKEFLALVKNLTIQGYTTSEYVMTTFYHYVMAPGHYYGCVPVPSAVSSAKEMNNKR